MEGRISNPPSLAQLALWTAVAFVAAIVIAITIVLPAEFGRDPAGTGQLLGLSAMSTSGNAISSGPAAHFYEQAYRTDVLEIPIFPKGGGGPDQLEYKLRMKSGGTLIYSWEIVGTPVREIYYDLHTQTEPEEKVIEFKQTNGSRSNGSLVAPADGIHGWYWQNRTAAPMVIRLSLAGFYELIPPGQPGNKAGILPATPGSAGQ
jgi:hypothetical protein